MFFEKILFAAISLGLLSVVAVCSEDPKADASPKHGTQAACEHVNDVCAGTSGFEPYDCSTSNADYDKLNDSQKARANAVIPCVMSAETCEVAIDCGRPPSEETPTSAKDNSTPTDAEAACEHINDVCKKEPSFEEQDCSASKAEYERLSDSDKELADAVAACIMDAEACKSAFECLKVN